MNKKKELARHLQTNFNFDLSADEGELDSNSAYFQYAQMKLAQRIKSMIQTDMDSLLQALYRIDVNDKETDRAFALGEIGEVSAKLAELIIHRQLRKMEYARDFYRNQDTNQDKDDE